MPLTGQNNLTGKSDFLIVNRISLKTLVILEKQIGAQNAFYLTEASCPLDPSIENYLKSKSSSGIAFSTESTDLNEFQTFLTTQLAEGKTIIYLPSNVAAYKGSICHIPEHIMEALGDFDIPPTPVYVGNYGSTILNAEVPLNAEGTPYVAILPKLAPGPNIAARLTGAWLEASADKFASLPQFNQSLATALYTGMKQHMNARIIDGIDDSTMTFGDLLGISMLFAERLNKITADRRVGIILPPGKGATIANLACIFAGKVPVNINYSNSESAFKSAVRQSGIERFITADTFVRKLQSFPWPLQRDLILMERELPTSRAQMTFAEKMKLLALKFLPSSWSSKIFKPCELSPDEEAILLFTSGSSSEPKGVPLTHRNVLGNIAECASRIDLSPDGRFLSSLPVFHGFGITIGLFFPLISGHDYVTYPSPVETKRLGELIKLHHTELVVSTPTFLRGYLRRCPADTFSQVRYLIVGAEKLPEDLAQSFVDKFSMMPLEGYGMSEASPVCSVNFPNLNADRNATIPSMKKNSVGALLPGIAVRITDPYTGALLPINYKGMIWLKGINIFGGYLGLESLNKEIFHDGWFRSGDIGSCDVQGFLRIEGRLSRFSKIAGEMVSHEAVEQALNKAMNINDQDTERSLAIVSIPDKQRGEALAMLSTSIKDYIPQRIMSLRYALLDHGYPPSWCPKEIIYVPHIPTLPTGKLDLGECRKIVYNSLNLKQDF